jgi:hypothetical protein
MYSLPKFYFNSSKRTKTRIRLWIFHNYQANGSAEDTYNLIADKCKIVGIPYTYQDNWSVVVNSGDIHDKKRQEENGPEYGIPGYSLVSIPRL